MRLTYSSEELVALRAKVDQFGTKGQARLKLCLDVTLYYEGGFCANAAALRAFYDAALDALRMAPRYYGLDGSNRWKAVRGDVLDMVRYWADGDTAERRVYGIRLECGPTASDVSDSSLRLYDNGINPGVVRLTLPVERAAELPAVARTLAAPMRFSSGHAGLGVNMAPDYPASLPDYPVYALSRRYRGIDFGDPVMFSTFVREGLKRIGFITFVGEGLLRKAGGAAVLRAVLDPAGDGTGELIVDELPHGIAVQAGTALSPGDVNRGQWLPLFHTVGRALRPLRFPDSILRGYDEIGGAENTQEWLAAFDGASP